MPFVNVRVDDGICIEEQKHALTLELTDAMLKYEGSRFREVTWVLIEELQLDGWHMGGRPFMGPDYGQSTS
jgi:4-oxalocrotonate tautomerase